MEYLTKMCPVQATGPTKDGRVFYFRARWADVEMSVADTLDAAVAVLCGDEGWFRSETLRTPWAGYLPKDRVEEFVERWLKEYEVDANGT